MRLFSILVTTYNRATALDYLLGRLAEYNSRGLDFDVVVSDDCSTDSTEETCNKWLKRLEHMKYIRLKENKGMDGNFISVYEACETEYCWLLGDARYVEYDDLKLIIETLKSRQYTALILKCHSAMRHESKVYTDINELISEQGWHITNNASCVIPSRFINSMLYNRYIGTTFLHMGIFVENICLEKNFKVRYLDKVRVKDIKTDGFTKVGWKKHPFLNFGKLWYEHIMSLPNNIDVEIKQKVLLDHTRYTKLFSLLYIMSGRSHYGRAYYDSYRENRQYMQFVSEIPAFVYDIAIHILPPFYKPLRALAKKAMRNRTTEAEE